MKKNTSHHSGPASLEPRQGGKIYSMLAGISFAVGSVLRILLALVNREANDNHLQVIDIILREGRIPGLGDCWQCYHPKLFHLFSAFFIGIFQMGSSDARIVVAQMISVIAGIITLIIIWRALRHYIDTASVRVIAFALVAMNPAFIGISAQATNDALVILFSTLALVSIMKLWQTRDLQPRTVVLLTLWCSLAVLTKGTGLIVVAVAVIMFLVLIMRSGKQRALKFRAITFAFLFCGILVVMGMLLGPYGENAIKHGSAFAINVDQSPAPHFIAETFTARPGITSIVNGYMTFRFGDMLLHPITPSTATDYPLHRTSLWSQFYGRATTMHFDGFPPSWVSYHPAVLFIVRALLIFSFLPISIGALGLCMALIYSAAVLAKKQVEKAPAWLSVSAITTIFALAFIIKSTLDYRDFPTMKAIYIFPALLAFALLFSWGYKTLLRLCDNHRVTEFVLHGICGIVCILSLAEVSVLIIFLAFHKL